MDVVIITGLSGAGKTEAMNCLEDANFYCIDNIPPALINSFIELNNREKSNIEKVAFVMDVRVKGFFSQMKEAISDLKNKGISYKIIYLEAIDSVLIRRYKESRRLHPLSKVNIEEGLLREKAILLDIRNIADFIIDTSYMKQSRLGTEIRNIISERQTDKSFVLNIVSFGFKKGIPREMDLVFDLRFIPNPYYVKSLRKLTGNNKKVIDYVLRQELSTAFIKNIRSLLDFTIPAYEKEGKYHLNIGFGCTGGQHRSVAIANEIFRIYEEMNIGITKTHRELK